MGVQNNVLVSKHMENRCNVQSVNGGGGGQSKLVCLTLNSLVACANVAIQSKMSLHQKHLLLHSSAEIIKIIIGIFTFLNYISVLIASLEKKKNYIYINFQKLQSMTYDLQYAQANCTYKSTALQNITYTFLH